MNPNKHLPTPNLNRLWLLLMALLSLSLACGLAQPAPDSAVAPTRTPLPTFTATPAEISQVDQPTASPTISISSTDTPTPTLTPIPTDTAPPPTSTLEPATATPSPSPLPPTETPPPAPTATPAPPTETPSPTPPPEPTATPEPVIRYILAGTAREFNCDYTAIYGSVTNANNRGLPNVEIRALGIHQTTGLDFTVRTDANGNYEAFRIPLPDLQSGQWAVMVMEEGREASERFHWASTGVCESDDTGHSQVLRVDWKLVE